jgi:hypothetical protein
MLQKHPVSLTRSELVGRRDVHNEYEAHLDPMRLREYLGDTMSPRSKQEKLYLGVYRCVQWSGSGWRALFVSEICADAAQIHHDAHAPQTIGEAQSSAA